MARKAGRKGYGVTMLDEDENLIKFLKKPTHAKPVSNVKEGRFARESEGDGGSTQAALHEEQLLHAAEIGDASKIKLLLHKDVIDVDTTDMMGRTALSLAVANQHTEVVEILLDKSGHFTVYEALLISIQHGYDDISEIIIGSPKYEEIRRHISLIGTNNFFLGHSAKSSKFTAEVTPISLASKRKRFEITLLLLQKGERIERPHKYYCTCKECAAKRRLDELKFAKWRLNTYKGLASEAYISLSCNDPILRAFEMYQELQELASVEKHYRREYESLAQKMTEYVVKLLDQVRGNEELDIILNEKKGMDDWGAVPDRLARLHLAIQYRQKKFVAHPSCQKKLSSVWYDNWTEFEHVTFLLRPLMALVFLLVYPFLALLYLLLPFIKLCSFKYHHKDIAEEIRRFVRIPYIKFLSSTLSYLVFMGTVAVYVTLTKPQLGHITKDNPGHAAPFYNMAAKYESQLNEPYVYMKNYRIRPTEPNEVHIFLLIYIIGLLWQECKQLYREGMQYFHSTYNIIDMSILTFFLASGALNYVCFIKVNEGIHYFSEESSWDSLVNRTTKALNYAYWLNSDRIYWMDEDPILLAEGLHAIASVLSIIRLAYVATFSERLGPLLISIGGMSADVMKFMGIFGFVFIAFLVGLHNLYWYYDPYIRVRTQIISHKVDDNTGAKSFGSLEKTFRTVFWALFGLGEKDDASLDEQFPTGFTERAGYIIFGIYSWTSVLVLLNMLIAMVTKSYDRVTDDQDTEWKFARSELYMEFIREGSTLAVPFNLIPSPKALINVFKYFCTLCCRPRGASIDITNELSPVEHLTEHKFRLPFIKGLSFDEEDHIEVSHAVTAAPGITERKYKPYKKSMYTAPTYQEVMKEVVMRYIYNEFQRNKGNEAEIEDLKQEISNLRFDMVNRMSTLQDGLKGNINYLSAKVDIISGGIFEDPPEEIKIIQKSPRPRRH